LNVEVAPLLLPLNFVDGVEDDDDCRVVQYLDPAVSPNVPLPPLEHTMTSTSPINFDDGIMMILL